MNPIQNLLSVEDLSISFRSRPILKSVNFSLKENTVTTLVGPSGVGKSTSLRAINRLLEEEVGFERTGIIRFRENDIMEEEKNEVRKKIGLVFQRPVIFPVSIRKNVLFAVHHLKLIKKEKYSELLEKVLTDAFLWNEVKDRLDTPALELSVGQQQRLSIARTLAIDPEILLMDEPTSALDIHATEKIEELILSLKNNHGIVLVTHSLEQALKISDQIVCLYPDDNCGEVVCCCRPDCIQESENFDRLPDYFRRALNSSGSGKC